MVNAYIVYGVLIKKTDIEDIFSSDEYPDWYTLVDGETQLADDFELDNVRELLKITDEAIKVRYIDFEYSTTYDSEGGEAILIGIELNRCDAHYSGVMKIMEAGCTTKFKMQDFIGENPVLEGLTMDLYIGLDAEK